MTFTQLRDFIEKRMRMSPIDQPAMLLALLGSGRRCVDEWIAKVILPFDRSQTNYYRAAANNMIGRVLRKYGVVSKVGRLYFLVHFDKLTPIKIETLVGLPDCAC